MPLSIIGKTNEGLILVYCKPHGLWGEGEDYDTAKCNVKNQIFKKDIKIPDGIEECF